MPQPDMVSVVIPMMNERDNVEELFQRLQKVFTDWPREHEIVFVDDGSTDDTFELLRELPGRNPNVRVLHLLRNFGQQSAVTAGIEYARGEIVLLMDGDLQIDPADIPRLVTPIDEGYDATLAYRTHRSESLLTRRLPSWLANRFFSLLLGVQLRDMGCGMQAFRRRIIQGLDRYGTLYQHAALYAVWRGSRVAEVPIAFSKRKTGSTKYNLLDLVTYFLDIFITFGTQPLPMLVIIALGSLLAAAGVLMGLALLVAAIAGHAPGALMWVVTLFFVLSGLQLVFMAVQNERVARIHNRLQNTPLFVVDGIVEAPAAEPKGDHEA